MNYSVLMSVYTKEKPSYLKLAIESIINQTIITDDFVIIEDGELNSELESIILEFESKYPFIHVHRRSENKGLGISLQEGVNYCKNEYIARMDSDDYSLPNRIEKQLEVMKKGFDIVGTNIDEFEDNPDNILASKKMPKSKAEIKSYFKFRNPFNHPSVMYKKSAVIAAGNYHDFYRLEDYELWIRMLANGASCCNIQKSLVRMRVNNEFYKRRGGKANLSSHLKLKKMMLNHKQISIFDYIKGCMLMIGRAYCPGSIKQFLYKHFLRK